SSSGAAHSTQQLGSRTRAASRLPRPVARWRRPARPPAPAVEARPAQEARREEGFERSMSSLQLSQVMRQTQRLVMTTQMQQSIQLLQMNSMELEQHINQELMENPYLEASEGGEEEDQLVHNEPDTGDSPREANDDAPADGDGDDSRADSK